MPLQKKKKYSKLFWNFSSDFPSNNEKVFLVEKCFLIFYFAKNNTIWLKIPTIPTLYSSLYFAKKFFHTSIGMSKVVRSITIFFAAVDHWNKKVFFKKYYFIFIYKWCLVLIQNHTWRTSHDSRYKICRCYYILNSK